jgi:hypothetical protein
VEFSLPTVIVLMVVLLELGWTCVVVTACAAASTGSAEANGTASAAATILRLSRRLNESAIAVSSTSDAVARCGVFMLLPGSP